MKKSPKSKVRSHLPRHGVGVQSRKRKAEMANLSAAIMATQKNIALTEGTLGALRNKLNNQLAEFHRQSTKEQE